VLESGVERMDWPDERQSAYVADHLDGWAGFLGKLRDLVDKQLAARGS